MSLSTGVKTAADFDASPLAVSARYQFAQQMSSEAVRLSAEIEIDNSPAKLDLVSSFGYGLVKNIWQTPKNKLKETKK